MNTIREFWYHLWQKYFIVRYKDKLYETTGGGIVGEIVETRYLYINTDEVLNEWVMEPNQAHVFGFVQAVLIRWAFMRSDKKKNITKYKYALEIFSDTSFIYRSTHGKELIPAE